MEATDPNILKTQYGTDARLALRVETHRLYGQRPGDLFAQITQELGKRGPLPERIGDVGAGNGNWYLALRAVLGPGPMYTAVDQSAGMVQQLNEVTQKDPRAHVQQGDAQNLPWPDLSQDWVGAHFMLYHVLDIASALREAWRVLRTGGLLSAATNGAHAYRELFALGQEAAAHLGLPGAEAEVSERFNLENGADYFPAPPERIIWDTGFVFPAAEPAVRYMESGPIDSHLGAAAHDQAVRTEALDFVRRRIEKHLERHGLFRVHSETGIFILRKD